MITPDGMPLVWMGKLMGLGQKNLGDTLLSNRYAILNGKQPLLFEFWFYKPNKEWQYLTISMVFGSNIQPVLKQWFEGAD